MLVSQFSFDLPRELIATSPARPRDSAKLLVVTDKLQDLSIKNISSFLKPEDIIIFNDTKVIPARLFGFKYKKLSEKPVSTMNESFKSGIEGRQIKSSKCEIQDSENFLVNDMQSAISSPKIQITLHKHDNDAKWRAFAKPARKLALGDIFKVSEEFYAEILAKNEGEVTLEFNVSSENFFNMLDKYGTPPLPPYIERNDKKPTESDFSDYQTIYANKKGAVAAPTAGLHFTDNLLEDIRAIGCKIEFVTLHVGAGTFLPMKVANTEDHIMHSEYGIISEATAKKINNAKQGGGRVFAVGTTSLRLLESATDSKGMVGAFSDETDIFITPGYKFKCVDMLITNFHLPESTLFMLVAAFCGLERMQAAYKHAIQNKYRFYSYGDACLLKLQP